MLVLAASGARLAADDVRYFEKDGMTYRETRQVVQRPVTETHMESRNTIVYRDKYTTELQDMPRSIPVAVTEYHTVPVWRNSWNIFAPPYLTYEQVPYTRWETRSDTVKTQVTRRQVVPETITQQVPVTSQRIVQDEIISRVAVSQAPAGTAPGSALPGTGLPGSSAPADTQTAASGAPTSIYGSPNQPNNASSDMAKRTAVGGVMKLDSDPPRSGADLAPAQHRRSIAAALTPRDPRLRQSRPLRPAQGTTNAVKTRSIAA